MFQAAVEKAGGKIISVQTTHLEHVVRVLHAQGIRRLMVEGGSHIIQSFLREHHLVHHLVVTIAPTLVGPGVLATGDNSTTTMPLLEDVKYQTFGRDIVMAAKFTQAQ